MTQNELVSVKSFGNIKKKTANTAGMQSCTKDCTKRRNWISAHFRSHRADYRQDQRTGSGNSKKHELEGKKHYKAGEILSGARQPLIKPSEIDSVLSLQKKLREEKAQAEKLKSGKPRQEKNEESDGTISFDPANFNIDEWKKKLYTGQEHRIQKRVSAEKISSDPIHVQCFCEAPKQSFMAVLKDFTSLGIQIETGKSVNLTIGSVFTLHLEIEKTLYQLKAVVRNVHGNSFGAEFRDLPPGIQKRLELLIGNITLDIWAAKQDRER